MKWKGFAIVIVVLTLVVAAALLNRKRVMSNLKKNQLSKNFSLDEFVVTATGIENVPGEKEIANLKLLCEKILQPLRDAVGQPIIISSGFRSKAVNAAIGGSSSTSQHMTGQAADFHIPGMTNQQIIDLIRKLRLPYDQVIDEQLLGKFWVHVSYKENPRLQWLTARDVSATRKNKYETVKIGLA